MPIENNILNIVKLWEDLARQFNYEERCGKCWRFFAPMEEKRLNIIKGSDQCCINVFLLRNKGQDFGSTLTYGQEGYLSNTFTREQYDILFLISSKEGINNYNELEGHNVLESRYETIFKPLRECITNDIITSICEHSKVEQWTGRYVYDYQDEQYYGLRISITQSYEQEQHNS